MPHGDAKPGAVTGVRWKGAGRRRWVVRVAWLSLLGLWGSLGWGRGAGIALPIDYFALGDSVASGYGLADDETTCRQSMLRIPGNSMRVYRRLLSCTNSSSWPVRAPRRGPSTVKSPRSSPPLAAPYPPDADRGANDFGWSDVLAFAQHLCTPDDRRVSCLGRGYLADRRRSPGRATRPPAGLPPGRGHPDGLLQPDQPSGAFWKRVRPRCLFVNVYDRSEAVARALNAAITQAHDAWGVPASCRSPRCTRPFTGMKPHAPGVGRSPRMRGRPESDTQRIPTRMPRRWAGIASTQSRRRGAVRRGGNGAGAA